LIKVTRDLYLVGISFFLQHLVFGTAPRIEKDGDILEMGGGQKHFIPYRRIFWSNMEVFDYGLL
jgi:hypothetical protein